jgi:O-antigen ligase
VGTDPVSEAVRVLSVLAMYLLASNVFNSEAGVRTLVVAAGLSGVVPAVWGLIEWPTLSPTVYAIDIARVSGPFVGPNPLGQYLAMTALILIGMPKRWLSARVRYLALAPQVVCIVPTYSRVGWIMLVAGVVILEWPRRKQVVLAMAVAVTAVVLLVPAVHERLLPSSTPTPGSAPTYESYQWRLDNWTTLLDKWTHEPFVGYGTDTTIFVNPRRTTLKQLAPDGGFEAHNLVVRVLVEGGLVLALAYLLWALVLHASLKRMIRSRWALSPVARLFGILWFLQLLVGLLTDDPFGNTAVLFVLFAVTGALEGAHRAARRARPRAGREARPSSYLPAPRTP